MNKDYAMTILEAIERKTLEHNCSLVKEALNYLMRLKSVQKDNELMNRIYYALHKKDNY
jgi:hypothetical protein